MRECSSFAPGHITGFFAIHDEASDPAAIGSRGAGFSVDRGVTSRVRVDDSGRRHGVVVRIDGQPSAAETTRRAVDLLVGDSSLAVEVDQRMDLPMSQGFGMSAAGALSAALALSALLGRPRKEAVWAAHCSEVLQRTGLGDVVGADVGGFEIRRRPGLPPHGGAEPWSADAPVGTIVLALASDPISTKRILTDSRRRAQINGVGDGLVDEFGQRPSLTDFVDLSRRFSMEAKLASPEIARLFDDLGPSAAVGQCMLGGSVFVFGATKAIRGRLQKAGPTFDVKLAAEGARVVEPPRVVADPAT